ncbi:Abi family protein [Fervidibacillus halotolerans]|uniref:Abi family protein n=1 Tax=Fervidibacillus halotolerans TaxID=2980027 RepID=A0A9E8LYW0_9BACI|nr:Abi family protein [Fervidibacillus halotolerans]WAA12265.1 Abi family protein [Fervidibacillus halotolerans]
MSKVKSIDSLMKYLRDKHGIHISGSTHKRKLRNIGYYHGYKGYRFIKKPSKKINYTDFNQILSVNECDMELKALFYPQIMFIETAIKNYVLEIVLKHGKTDRFDTIFDTLLTNYKRHKVGSKDYKKALNQRLRLKNKFYETLARNYNSDKPVVQHFYHQDRHVPIWAIFEVISLGEFGNFVSCLDIRIKRDISKSLNLNQAFDGDAKMTENIIFLIKDLRNSIAHNDVIFDTRFQTGKPKKSLINALKSDTGIQNITFNTIVDYLILLIFIQKKLYISKTELNKIVNKFETVINHFRTQIPISVYHQIFHTDTRNKINSLKTFIKS